MMQPGEIARLEEFEREARSLEGWNLAYQPEQLKPGPPWDYVARAHQLALEAQTLVDLGTGGAEVFSEILAGTSGEAYATEEYHVNAPVAAKRLGSSVPVTRCSSERLPFADATFDLVLARHEAIDPREVARVLRPGGRCLTQQVVHDHLHELSAWFPDMTRYPDHFREYQQGFQRAGMRVETASEFRAPLRFLELGHLVYLLAAAPWAVPEFSVATCRENLEALVDWEQDGHELVFTGGFHLIEAVGPVEGD